MSTASAELRHRVLSTLLYYDIFRYPLTADEVFTFIQRDDTSRAEVQHALSEAVAAGDVFFHEGFFSMQPEVDSLVIRRRSMEVYARRHWFAARIMTSLIKRVPFVSCVMITGTLSKNLSAPDLDIDYFIITQPRRLWIVRTMLVMLKHALFLGSRKYFCLNYFVTEDGLSIEERNVFTATEIAYAKPLYNTTMHGRFIEANDWVHGIFPNWSPDRMLRVHAHDRESVVRRMLELPMGGVFGDRLDLRLMHVWEGIWRRRYPHLSEETRSRLFRVSRTMSRAHPPDFQTRILAAYAHRLSQYGIALPGSVCTPQPDDVSGLEMFITSPAI